MRERNDIMQHKTAKHRASTRAALLVAAAPALLLGGCSRDGEFAPVDMWNRSRLKPYEPVQFFENGNSSRPLVAGTVARGQLRAAWFGNGTDETGRYLTTMPREISAMPMRSVLERGRERYNIYCQPCHGITGYGDGMIVKRGFSPPPSYHIARLREAPLGHYYDVITNGYGAMYSYAARVPPEDRWAIASYIRVLQRSQNATINDVPANLRGELEKNGQIGMTEPEGGRTSGSANSQAYPGERGVGKPSGKETTSTGAVDAPASGNAPQTQPLEQPGANAVSPGGVMPSGVPNAATPSTTASNAARTNAAAPVRSVPLRSLPRPAANRANAPRVPQPNRAANAAR